MLADQRRQPPFRQYRIMILGQVHHQRQERRLRPAEIIGPGAVGDMPVTLDQIDEIGEHRLDQRGLAVAFRPSIVK